MNSMLQVNAEKTGNKSLLHFFSILFIVSSVLLVVYYPGLTGGFVLDDKSNILSPPGIAMEALSWQELTKAAQSMANRPLARATFGLNYLATGFDPYFFKLTNLFIHLINSMLVFYITKFILNILVRDRSVNPLILSTTIIALIISLAWAIHPINLTSVLYAVQRMNVLSALFTLMGILLYINGRVLVDSRPARGFIYISLSALVFTPLAWYSKENGAILLLFLFVLESIIFRFSAEKKWIRNGLCLFFIFVLAIPLLVTITYLYQHPTVISSGYASRSFSLIERLLTESRIIWSYIYAILFPITSSYGLFQDDVIVSKNLLSPYSTLFSILGILGLLGTAIFLVKKIPYLSFGILIFLTGHIIESTVIPLELKYEHRNYLPSIGIIFPLILALVTIGKKKKHAQAGITAALVLVLIYAFVTHTRANDWSNNTRLYLTEVRYHPNSPRANYEAGKFYGQLIEQGIGDSEANYRKASSYFSRVSTLKNNSTSGLFGLILASIDSNNMIKNEWVEELDFRLKNYPLEKVNLLCLDKLTDCITSTVCNDQQLNLERLIDSSLNNKYISHKSKIILNSIRANYQYKVKNNITTALASAREASRIALRNKPNDILYQVKLVQYLIMAGEVKEAKELLEDVRNRSNNSQYIKETNYFELLLQDKQLQ